MGLETTCRARFGSVEVHGKLQLETDFIRFAGEPSCKIALRDLESASVDDGTLFLEFGGRIAAFDLGPKAATWLDRIRSPKSLFQKLGVSEGVGYRLIGEPRDGFEAELLAVGARMAEAQAAPDLIFAFAQTLDDLASLGSWIEAAGPATALWIVYPKARKDITEAAVLRAGRIAGLTDTKVVRFSESQTALKFVRRKSDR